MDRRLPRPSRQVAIRCPAFFPSPRPSRTFSPSTTRRKYERNVANAGDPNGFCSNNSGQTTRNWFLPGDPDLTAITQSSNPYAMTYDTCVVEFDFRCVVPSPDGASPRPVENPEVSFEYVFGSEECAQNMLLHS